VVSALAARALTFDYPGGRAALEKIEFALGRGELLCVVGPNGSGKSTLLRLCAGLLAPKSGSIAIGESALAALAPRERAQRIAYVPQALQGVPDVTARVFVLGGRYAHHPRWAGVLARASAADHAAVARALTEADALELAERPLSELSLGQFQRVRIARALAQEAPLLLFDEPTAALDPEHEVRLFLLIERAVAAGRSALVVTHALALASRFAYRTLVLQAGRIAAEGPSERVFQPAILEPIFGPHLHFTRAGERPLVVPWPNPSVGERRDAILPRPPEDPSR
jgi:iron complex transport system ATP-binding protein